MSLLLIKSYDMTFISSHQIESSRVIDVILPIHLVPIKLLFAHLEMYYSSTSEQRNKVRQTEFQMVTLWAQMLIICLLQNLKLLQGTN